MNGVIVGDFGVRNGVHTYRVNGTKEDLEFIINECRNERAEFADEPVIKVSSRSEYTTLLKIKVDYLRNQKSNFG